MRQPGVRQWVDFGTVRRTARLAPARIPAQLFRPGSRLGVLAFSAACPSRFSGSAQAVLILRNAGPAISLGLPPNTLRQDLFLTLAGGDGSGGQLSVGALHGSVTLQESVAPEPHSAALLMVGGAFLCLLARILPQTKLIPNQPFAIRLDTLILSIWQIRILLPGSTANQPAKHRWVLPYFGNLRLGHRRRNGWPPKIWWPMQSRSAT